MASPSDPGSTLDSDKPPSPHQSKSRPRQFQKRVASACEACKRRKTKCSGEPAPCKICIAVGTECIINLSRDMRRREAIKRSADETRILRQTLNALVRCVCEGETEILVPLAASLRTSKSFEDIATAIRQYSQRLTATSPEQDQDTLTDATSESAGNLLLSGILELASDDDDTLDLSVPSAPPPPQSDGLSEAKRKQKQTEELDNLLPLLHRLRTGTDEEGLDILHRTMRSASSPNAFTDGLRSPDVSGFRQTPQALQNEEERRGWHPALQLRRKEALTQDSDAEVRRESLGSARKPSLRVSMELDQDSYESNEGIVPAQSAAVVSPMRRKARGQDSERATTLLSPIAREPYIERRDTWPAGSAWSGNTDLCVAIQEPESCWRVPVHLVQPLLVPDDSTLSRVYTDYLYAARRMIASGTSLVDILGSNDDVVVDLFFRPRREGDKFDCSSWACELCRSFDEYDMLTRLASSYLLTWLMRWLLIPSPEIYEKVPEMIRPTPAQRMIPHIGAIDLNPLPCVRDATIAHLRDWVTSMAEADLRCNWPKSKEEAVELVPDTQSLRLSEQFTQHITNYDNWSIRPSFFSMFPELVGKVKTHL